MREDSSYFAQWLSHQGEPTILPNQYVPAASVMDRLGNGDLISVLFNAPSEIAVKALSQLKHRFEDEMYCLQAMNQGDKDETDWG